MMLVIAEIDQVLIKDLRLKAWQPVIVTSVTI
jgi:hypothetical protein